MGGFGLPALAIKPPEQPDLLGQAGKVMQLKNMMQQGQLQGQALQSGQLDLQAKQRVAQDQQTVMQAFQQAPQGATISDILPSLQGKITPQTYASLQKADLDRRKEVAELDDKNIVVAKGVHDQLQQIYNNAMNMPDDQLAAQTPQLAQQINSIPGNKFKINPTQPITKQELQSFGPVLGLNEAYLAQEAAKREQQAKLQGQQADTEQKVRSNTATQLANVLKGGGADAYKQALGELPYKIASQFPQNPKDPDEILQMGMTPHEQATVPVDKAELKDYLAKHPGKGPADFAAWKASIAPSVRFNLETKAGGDTTGSDVDWDKVAAKLGMSKTALAQASEKFYQTGQMPPMGRGMSGPATNKAIMNYAAFLHPDGNLAANSQEYKANTESLKKLQSTFDQVSAFEETARKNIDLLQTTAQKIPDLGARYANIPVRALSGKIMGDENMAAFKTALNTAQTEAAKVLNSSNASGVLSDSARHELQDIIDGNLSYKAMVKVFDTLKTDMSNRHVAYQDQIEAIKKRTGGGSQQQQKSDPLGIR